MEDKVNREKGTNMQSRNAPVGLSILAGFNIFFALVNLLPVSRLIAFGIIWSGSSLAIIYLAIRVFFVLGYFISAIGFIKCRFFIGYILGNIMAIAKIIYIIVSIFLLGLKGSFIFQQAFFQIAYSIVLLLLLNIRYRRYFRYFP